MNGVIDAVSVRYATKYQNYPLGSRYTGRRIPPLIMGHEASGLIAQVGGEVIARSATGQALFDA
jgi:hypothetical protein